MKPKKIKVVNKISDRESAIKRVKIVNGEKKEKMTAEPIIQTDSVEKLSNTLLKQIRKEEIDEKMSKISSVLKLVGAGAFIAASFAFPQLPLALKPLFKEGENNAWMRFNIPYLKRTLRRLEKEKLVETEEKDGFQIVKITQKGKRRIFRCALAELKIERPKVWSGNWYLISYDLPKQYSNARDYLREYLTTWDFYPLHESVFLHAYPCYKEINFLREYLGIGEYVRVFKVSQIENDQVFKDYFGV